MRDFVIHIRRGLDDAKARAFFAQWMLTQPSLSRLLPTPSIATFRAALAPSVMLLTLRLGVLLTATAVPR